MSRRRPGRRPPGLVSRRQADPLPRCGSQEAARPNIYTIHSDGSGLKQLTHYPEPKIVGEESSSFSPDGKWITFSRFSTTSYAEIFVMRSDGMAVVKSPRRDRTSHPTGGCPLN